MEQIRDSLLPTEGSIFSRAQGAIRAPPTIKKTFSDLLFSALLFCYFALSSAELLHVTLGIFKPKAGHCIAFLLGGLFFATRPLFYLPRPLFKGFIFLLGSFFLSACLGAAPLRSFGYLGVYLVNFVFYFMLPIQMMMRMSLPSFFRIYWAAFGTVGFYAGLQVVLSLFEIYDPFALQRVGSLARGQAWMYEPSYYALYMIPYVMFHNGKALLGEAPSRLWRGGGLLFLRNLALVLSTSTGLLVSYPLLFALFGITQKWSLIASLTPTAGKNLKRALGVFLLSMGGITALFYETALHSFFKFFYVGFQNHVSFFARWQGIKNALEIFFTHPVLGVGMGGMGPFLFHESSPYAMQPENLEEFEIFEPTNAFTEILASLGLVGLGVFCYLTVVFYRLFRQVMQAPFIDASTKKTALALFFSLILLLLVLQMNQGLFRPYIWIHAAVVVGYLQRQLLHNDTIR